MHKYSVCQYLNSLIKAKQPKYVELVRNIYVINIIGGNVNMKMQNGRYLVIAVIHTKVKPERKCGHIAQGQACYIILNVSYCSDRL